MKIKLRTVDSIADDLEAVERRIAARAVEVFRERGAALGRAVDDWLTAEKESIWRPALEVLRTGDAFVLRAAIAGIAPEQLDLRVTATELLLSADVHHGHADRAGDLLVCEFANGPLFRSYRFPERVDPERVTAECQNGMLCVTAPLAQVATRVQVTAA